jgi:hypothetical protein
MEVLERAVMLDPLLERLPACGQGAKRTTVRCLRGSANLPTIDRHLRAQMQEQMDALR